ncbi:hypothetical protein HG530_004568 [Fusarium avenaceum]|nr:hypothetical protein HG530_004568 [Fusarium avenaceum]
MIAVGITVTGIAILGRQATTVHAVAKNVLVRSKGSTVVVKRQLLVSEQLVNALKVANFNKILDLANEVRESDTSHVEKASGIFSIHWRALGVGMFPLEPRNDLKDLWIVRVEALDEIDVELDLL